MSSVVKITKGLAAIGTEERERALVDVQLWVENTKFEKMDAKKIESDFLRIWQGIFYSFWLTDGLEKQYSVSVIISEMINLFNDQQHEAALLFLSTFFQTLNSTWPKLDKHRVAKYMSLVRRIIQQSFVFLNKNQFQEPLVKAYLQVIQSNVLNVNNRLIGSLQAHFIRCLYPSLKQFGYEFMNKDAFESIVDLCLEFYAETFDFAAMRVLEEELFEPMIHEGDAQYETEKQLARMHEQDDYDSSVVTSSEGDDEENLEDLIIFPIDYKWLSDRMDKLSVGQSTENREECLSWKNKFYDRYVQSLNDPMTILDDLEMELEQVKQQQQQQKNVDSTKQSKKQSKKQKKAAAAAAQQQQEAEAVKKVESAPVTPTPSPKKAKKEATPVVSNKEKSPVAAAKSPAAVKSPASKSPAAKSPAATSKSPKNKSPAKSTPVVQQSEPMEIEKVSTPSKSNSVTGRSPATPEPVTPLLSRKDAKRSGRRTKNTVEKHRQQLDIPNTPSRDASMDDGEDTPNKRVLFSLEKNRTKMYQLQDIVASSPVSVKSPSKSLLKRKLFEGETVPPMVDHYEVGTDVTPFKKRQRMSNNIKDLVKQKRKSMSPSN